MLDFFGPFCAADALVRVRRALYGYDYGYENCRGHPGAPPIRYNAYSTLSGSTMGRCVLVRLCHSLQLVLVYYCRVLDLYGIRYPKLVARDNYGYKHTCQILA